MGSHASGSASRVLPSPRARPTPCLSEMVPILLWQLDRSGSARVVGGAVSVLMSPPTAFLYSFYQSLLYQSSSKIYHPSETNNPYRHSWLLDTITMGKRRVTRSNTPSSITFAVWLSLGRSAGWWTNSTKAGTSVGYVSNDRHPPFLVLLLFFFSSVIVVGPIAIHCRDCVYRFFHRSWYKGRY